MAPRRHSASKDGRESHASPSASGLADWFRSTAKSAAKSPCSADEDKGEKLNFIQRDPNEERTGRAPAGPALPITRRRVPVVEAGSAKITRRERTVANRRVHRRLVIFA
jgi:hypothetical protein